MGRDDSCIKSQELRPGMVRKQCSRWVQDKREKQVQTPGSRLGQLWGAWQAIWGGEFVLRSLGSQWQEVMGGDGLDILIWRYLLGENVWRTGGNRKLEACSIVHVGSWWSGLGVMMEAERSGQIQNTF